MLGDLLKGITKEIVSAPVKIVQGAVEGVEETVDTLGDMME